jgi:hypothetical protein
MAAVAFLREIGDSVQREIDRTAQDLAGPLSIENRAAKERSRDVLAALQGRIQAVRAEVEAGLSRQSGEVNWRMVRQNLSFPPLPNGRPIALRTDLLDPACPRPSRMNALSDECRSSFETAAVVIRHGTWVSRVLHPDVVSRIQGANKDAQQRRAIWDNYFKEPRHQYPWELAVNSWRYRNDIKGKPPELHNPPSDQLIALHPSLAMEYVRKAQKGDRFQPVLILELIGFNRWNWDEEGKSRGAHGASLIASYSDRGNLASTRYGVMVHWNHNVSFGVTHRNGATGLFLSLDAGKLLGPVSGEARQKFGDPTK